MGIDKETMWGIIWRRVNKNHRPEPNPYPQYNDKQHYQYTTCHMWYATPNGVGKMKILTVSIVPKMGSERKFVTDFRTTFCSTDSKNFLQS